MDLAGVVTLPGGPARRTEPAGAHAGSPLARISGPGDALRLVARELSDAEGALRDLVHTDVAAVPAVAGYLLDAGGKRIRPALTAIAARAVGFDGAIVPLMCVGELLHLGSLLHDDVVDDGVLRRGRTAAHRVYGNAVSVLTGDFCLARAVWLAAEHGGLQAATELGRTVTEMAEGEVLQLQRAGDLDTDLATWRDVVDRKSAALISWCAAAPGWASGDATAAEALRTFGRRVGVAFQITDDVLDYRDGTGKKAGADLRQRKVTLPLLYAMDTDPSVRDVLREGEPSDRVVFDLLSRVRASGALDAALADGRQLVSEAIAALDPLPSSAGRDALIALAHHLVERAR